MARYRLTKIYTRTGNGGVTSLGGGQRVSKESELIEALGTVDELNSCLGVAAASGLDPALAALLIPIQNELFQLGGELCLLEADRKKYKARQIDARQVKSLEEAIDRVLKELRPLENFVIPGGALGAAQLHVCRCVCRRAERCVARLKRSDAPGPNVIPYLNRLSDLLFVMARYENLKKNCPEKLWAQQT